MVDLQDVAEVAAKVVLNRQYSGAIFELVGQEALSPKKVADILSEELGIQVSAEEETVEAWKTRMEGSSLGDYQLSTLFKMFEYYGKHGFAGNRFILRHLLEREPTSFRDFVRRLLGT
jgi:uncharacterized protein YbjT (DUF2867 family)